MILCKDCDPIAVCCDFCKHYDFNANAKGQYTGDGHCRLHNEPADPGEVCDDFHCENVKQKKKRQFTKK